MASHQRSGARGLIGLATVGALLLGTPTAAATDDDGPVEAGIFVEKVEDLPEDFIHGADISMVLSLEESGVTFYDTAGNEADLFAVLADAGITDIRIRVWNDPWDSEGRGYGGGNVDVSRAVEIGQRATAHGMSVLVNFHYSDFWADPGKQFPPKAWEGMTVDDKVDALGEFTRDALEDFRDAGVDVRMVQVGNETNHAVSGVSAWPDRARMFSAGSAAVREVFPDALVALHFTNPERAGTFAEYAAQLDQHGVDYDVFASSYYAFWHGTLENLTDVLSHVAETYDKKIIVTETSWAYTLEDGDGTGNIIGSDPGHDRYSVSPQGQADALRDVIAAVNDLGDAGLGVYYWEPAWLPVGPPEQIEQNWVLWETYGSGWATSYAAEYDPDDAGEYYGGSAWENQALFDFEGHPLESLQVFRYVYTGAVAPLEVVRVESPELVVVHGDEIALPSTVRVTYNDGSVDQHAVTWNDDDVAAIDGPGTYEVRGLTESDIEVTAEVVVQPVNYVVNGSFEDSDTSMWTISGAGAAITTTNDAADGTRAVQFWAPEPYEFTVSQQIEGLTAGTYRLSATTQGGDSPQTDERRLTATTSAGTYDADLLLDGWRTWRTTTVEDIVVEDDGTATVAATFTLSGGAWGTFDDVVLERTGDLEPEWPAWDPAQVYVAGDMVNHQGADFKASWWTRGQEPGDPHGPWQEVAAAPDGTALWTPSRVFDTGDVVLHDDVRYTARWWTRNQEPGTSPWGPWETDPA
ncbi:glycosyl hydrolase 53 family protein [Phytoactinopolyspora mesophila]|uniref:Arabinogalactan endo-beta-1,4-galactanase n=1 Tax=Phytoactinopolyspora mesophila TaxID=2650750 RepID=A0A7K3LXH6_9ACTN|nr:glycosyl hydrolase 53 family protein [Phytoactinopolyspora mesophila]NDL55734.1 arabinogalactan endo-1,4-beta-galactosidase [Phytoactinopolyspora mesophila]